MIVSRNASPIVIHGVIEAPITLDTQLQKHVYNFGVVPNKPFLRNPRVDRGKLIVINTVSLVASCPEDVFVGAVIDNIEIMVFGNYDPLIRTPISMGSYHPFPYEMSFIANCDNFGLSMGIGGKLDAESPLIVGHPSLKIRASFIGHEFSDKTIVDRWLSDETFVL